MRVEHLVVNPDLPADMFRLRIPTGVEVVSSDDGFRRVGLSETPNVAGYAAVVPSWVPEGYELATVTVAREGGQTGREAGNPPSRNVVSLSYRRGFDQFLLTTRLSGPHPERWTDPLATGEGFVDKGEQIVLRAGALRGVTADLVIVPRGVPHVWAVTDELVVTVGGDLSRAELVRIAESVQRRR
jgi:hypothetical protein